MTDEHPHDGRPQGAGVPPAVPADEVASDVPSAAISRGELQQRALSGTAWTVAHIALSIPLAFAANAVVARVLGVLDYGRLAFLTAALAFAAQATSLGYANGVIQFGTAAEARGRTAEADRFLRGSVGFRLVFQAPVLLGVALLVLGSGDPFLLAAVLVGVLVPAWTSGGNEALAIENRTAAAARIAIVTNVVVQVVVVVAALGLQSASGVWASRFAATGALVPLALLFLSRSRRRAVLAPRSPLSVPAGFWGFSLHAGFAGLVSTLVFSRSEIFLLEWLGSPEALGIFALAFGVAVQVNAPGQAMLGPLIPAVAGIVSAHADAATRAFDRAIGVASVLVGLLSVVALPAVYFLIPVVYGQEYADVAAPFLVLALVSAYQVVVSPVWAFLSARLMGRALLVSNVVGLVLNVAAAVALIPLLGLWGAVAANVVGQLAVTAVMLQAELRAQRRSAAVVYRALRPLLLAGVLSVLAVGTVQPLGLPPVVAAAVGSATAGLGYVVGLRLTRTGLARADHEAVLSGAPARARRPVGRMLGLVTAPAGRASGDRR